MQRRPVLALLIAGIGASTLLHPAQAQRRLWVVGYLGAGTSRNDAAWLSAFRKGMVDLHWTEGVNYVIDTRFADSVRQAVAARAAELVATNPDVILTPGDGSTPSLLARTKTIPIVFAVASDPVRLGFAASLHRPGGNATGLTSQATDLGAKRLQILREAFPKIAHVAVLFEPEHSSGPSQLAEIEKQAPSLQMRISPVQLRGAEELDGAFQRMAAIGAEGWLSTRGVLITTYRQAIIERMIAARLPAIFDNSAYADAGGLMSYGISTDDNFRRAASYVDRILKGAKPADLPIEQPTKFELVVNLRTAKAMGLRIPQSILVRTDRVIK